MGHYFKTRPKWLTLGQDAKKNSNLRPKCSSQDMFWLGVKFLRSRSKFLKVTLTPKNIDL